MKKNLSISLVMLGVMFMSAPSAFAQTPTTTQTKVNIDTLLTVPAVIQKGDEAIAKRLESLNKFNNRVMNVKYLPATEKATISADIQASISALNALKVKLDADTDLATAKNDYKSILEDNRIYSVVLPQERGIGITSAYTAHSATLQNKITGLQTRTDAAHSAGKDTTAIQAKLDDAKAKLVGVQTQSTIAANAASALQVDHGDTAIIATNKTNRATMKTAITAFRTGLQTIRTDLKSAHAGLKALGM